MRAPDWAPSVFFRFISRKKACLQGWGIFPLTAAARLFGLPESSGSAYLVFAAAVLLIMGLWSIVRRPLARRPSHVADALMLALAFILLVSPHYSWYFLWLVPISVSGFMCLLCT